MGKCPIRLGDRRKSPCLLRRPVIPAQTEPGVIPGVPPSSPLTEREPRAVCPGGQHETARLMERNNSVDGLSGSRVVYTLSRLNSIKRGMARKALRAGIARSGPFESELAIQIDAVTESDARLLAILTPQAISPPRIFVPIRVESGDKDEIEGFK